MVRFAQLSTRMSNPIESKCTVRGDESGSLTSLGNAIDASNSSVDEVVWLWVLKERGWPCDALKQRGTKPKMMNEKVKRITKSKRLRNLIVARDVSETA